VLELIDQSVAVIFVIGLRSICDAGIRCARCGLSAEAVCAGIVSKRLWDRARAAFGREEPPAAELSAAARPPQQYLQRIVVKDGARRPYYSVERLDYAEAQDDYVSLHSQARAT